MWDEGFIAYISIVSDDSLYISMHILYTKDAAPAPAHWITGSFCDSNPKVIYPTFTCLITHHEGIPGYEARPSESNRNVSRDQTILHQSADLRSQNLPVPKPKEGQVLVDVYASALNFFEYVLASAPPHYIADL